MCKKTTSTCTQVQLWYADRVTKFNISDVQMEVDRSAMNLHAAHWKEVSE
jgi:hypothetical protein